MVKMPASGQVMSRHNGGPQGVAARALEWVLRQPRLFHFGRIPTYLGSMGWIRDALEMAAGERLLDVGCGTGLCAAAAGAGSYVGIDDCVPYLDFGRRRPGSARRTFVAMSATHRGFAAGSFDKALVVNLVHHLEVDGIDRLFDQLTRLVTRRIVLLDAAPDAANAVERFLLAHDRGAYIRPRAELRRLLERHCVVEDEVVFHNFIRTAPQVMFRLTPKRPPLPCPPD
jgi:SAM-dependent methyltransferase